MRGKIIGYWVTTSIVFLLMLSGGIMQLVQRPDAVEGIVRLGYPAYFVLVLGAWKVLGAIALVAPRMGLVKEWAYAGIFFDLTGAAVSHAAMHGSIGNIIAPLFLAGLAIASYVLRPDARRLQTAAA